MYMVVSKVTEDKEMLFEVHGASEEEFRLTGGGPDKIIQKAEVAFNQVLDTFVTIGNRFSEAVQKVKTDKTECEISFGIKISAEGSIVVAKSSAEAQITATISWK